MTAGRSVIAEPGTGSLCAASPPASRSYRLIIQLPTARAGGWRRRRAAGAVASHSALLHWPRAGSGRLG
jgi:hypothetical protein